MRTNRRHSRGQALVEMAIGATVLVAATLLMLHVHEVGHVSLKMQEAASYAAWDVTGRSLRPVDNSVSRFSGGGDNTAVANEVVELSKTASANRYSDMDGRTQGQATRMMFTSAAAMAIKSTINAEVFAEPFACEVDWVKSPHVLSRGMKAQVSVEGTAKAVNMANAIGDMSGKGIMGGGGSKLAEYRICGMGRLVGTQCAAKLLVMTDDWSVRSGEWCEVQAQEQCGNPEYFLAVKDAFVAHTPANKAASAMVTAVVEEPSPYDESRVYLSYRDEQTAFKENGPPMGEGKLVFETGPGPASRSPCFLGVSCP